MEEKEAKVFRFMDIFKAWNHSFRFHRLLLSGFALLISAIIAIILFKPSLGHLILNPVYYTSPEVLLNFQNLLAIVLISFIFFITRMCISFSIRKEVVDDEIFVGWKDVGKFLKKHLKTFLFYVIGWIVIFVLMALGQLFFYAIGAIPIVGSLWLSFMYIIPFAISVFLMLTLVVLLFADKFGAVIIGVEQNSAMDSIISLYHFVKDHGIYIVVTSIISAIVGIIASAFVLYILKGAVVVTNWGANFVMGNEFAKITIPKYFGFLNYIFPSLQSSASAGGWYTVPGFIISIFLIVVAAIGIAYIFTYMTAAQTFIYLSSQEKFFPKIDEDPDSDIEAEDEKNEEADDETKETTEPDENDKPAESEDEE